MSEDGLFKRILRGSTGTKKTEEKEKRETPLRASSEVRLPEKILNTPLSRRGVLGGAATTAGQMASSVAIPQSPIVIQQGVKEAAALLATRVGRGGFSYLDLVQKFNQPFEYQRRKSGSYSPKEEYEGTGEFSPTIESTFASGAPLTSKGQWAHQQFFEMSWLSRLNLPGALKISDLKNPEIIAEAYRLAGTELPEGRNIAEDIQNAIGVLQRVTGVSDEQTVGDLERQYGNGIVKIAKKILDDPDFFPARTLEQMSSDERVRHETALRYLEDTIKHSGVQIDPDLSQRITEERRVYREFHDERDKQREAQKNATKTAEDKSTEGRRMAREQEVQRLEDGRKKTREEFNEKIKNREEIECSVQSTVREPRDNINAKVFLIKPENYEGVGEFNGLTRMHVQHLRQILTLGKKGRGLKQPTLDNFDEANTKVEILGEMIRVSTTDEKFQEYLGSFVGDEYKMLRIPNRLQMVIPPEKEEN